jgi:MoxR-like ATPase
MRKPWRCTVQTSNESRSLLVEDASQRFADLRQEIHRVLIGQDQLIELMVLSLLADGHLLIIGVPGLAKTLAVRVLARTLGLKFQRIQFTPDLLPSDITGSDVLEGTPLEGGFRFRFLPGPLFANLILADEINRTPPRTQAALLEAMEERSVTVGGVTHPLPRPFIVLATQNPIEQEGTFPLPEAQLDRFAFSLEMDYPSLEEEIAIVSQPPSPDLEDLKKVLGAEEILEFQRMTREIPVPAEIQELAVNLVRRTRPGDSAPQVTRRYIQWGVSPRGAQILVHAGRARALLYGHPVVGATDLVAVAPYVLSHRVVLNYQALREGVRPAVIIQELIHTLEITLG